MVDPGFGFGKTLAHNLQLLRHLDRFTDLAASVLVGISRKSMIGALLDVPVGERLVGSLAAATIAVWRGSPCRSCSRCSGDGPSLARLCRRAGGRLEGGAVSADRIGDARFAAKC